MAPGSANDFLNITVPLLGLVDTAVIGHLDSPIYRGRRDRRGGDQLPVHAAVVPAHEHHHLAAQALGAQNPQALARAFMQPLLLALLAGERSSCCAIR